MTTTEKDIYLELLQSALWERDVNTSLLKGEWSWKAVIDAFVKHDLLGVVANNILTLPENNKPQMQDIVVVYNYLGNLLQNHNKLNRRLADIMPQLESVGCHPVLLKGQGLSVLYPNGCVRACGDLDIYVGTDNIDKAKIVVNSLATQDELNKVDDHAHHYCIDLNGVSYEIHYAPGTAANEHYKSEYLSVASKYLIPELCEKVTLSTGNDSNAQISVPYIDFNVWFVFDHLVRHFCHRGVGYRQFCDWMIVIREWNRRSSMGLEQLKNVLCNIGLLRAWKILGGILVYQLGLPKEEFPFFDEQLAMKSQGYVKDEIIEGSRFCFSSLDELGVKGHGMLKVLYYLRSYYFTSRPNFVISTMAPLNSFMKLLKKDIALAFKARYRKLK